MSSIVHGKNNRERACSRQGEYKTTIVRCTRFIRHFVIVAYAYAAAQELGRVGINSTIFVLADAVIPSIFLYLLFVFFSVRIDRFCFQKKKEKIQLSFDMGKFPEKILICARSV